MPRVPAWMYLILLPLGPLIAGCASEPQRPKLRSELLQMAKADQAIRRKLLKGGLVKHPPKKLVARMRSIDATDTARLKQMVVELGRWPGVDLVGERGEDAAWLLAQHADERPDIQKFFLEKLRVAVDKGQAPPRYYAYLLDRVRLKEGKRQVYGTQFGVKDGRLVMKPVEDRADLDARREKIGLGPIADYEALMQKIYAVP